MREDWVECVIEEVLQELENGKILNQGWSPQCEKYPSKSPSVWGVLKTTAIQKNEFRENENKELPLDKDPRPHLEVRIGDILLTCAGPRNRCGVACLVLNTRPKLLLSGKMYRFKPNETVVSTKFLNFFLQTQESWVAIDKMKTGTSDSGLNLTHKRFRKLPVRFPPLPIQRAIVAKIEDLFTDLDRGIADLKKAQAQLKVYRQAVLKKAFEGELTKEWRELQTDLPTAEEMLEQIKVEREKHYERQITHWTELLTRWNNNGGESKRPTKPKKLSDFTVSFDDRILDLPEEWREGSLDYVADAIDPQPSHRTPPKVEGGVPFVSIADINKITGEIDFRNARSVGEDVLQEHIERYQLRKGDFVIGKIGTIGKPFFIPEERFFTLSANVVLVRPFKESSVSKFLYYLILSPVVEQQFKKGAKATTQAAFGIKKVRLLRVPLCSKSEQQQVVREIESRLSVCDKVEESITESLAKAKALRQSILKKAFEGRLLSKEEIATCKQAPDYEPAAVLLERIKEEKKKKG